MKTKIKKPLFFYMLLTVVVAASLVLFGISVNYQANAESEYAGMDFYLINNSTEYSVCSNGDEVTELIIPSEYNGKPVTEIMDSGFMFCESLEVVEIPDSITRIGDYAFSDCSNLSELYIASNARLGLGVQTIGDEAFAYCNLQKSIIPKTVTEEGMGYGVFDGNPDTGSLFVRQKVAPASWSDKMSNYAGEIVYGEDNLVFREETDASGTVCGYSVIDYQNIDIPGALTIPCHVNNLPVINIKKRAFKDCAMNMLEIQTNCTHGLSLASINIESVAFTNSHIDHIILNNEVTFWDQLNQPNIMSKSLFANSTMLSVTLPNNMTSISTAMFSGCKSLTTILTTDTEPNHLPLSIKELGGTAFKDCISINKLYIPSIDKIGNNVFAGWTSKQTIKFDMDCEPENWGINWNGGDANIVWNLFQITFNPNNQLVKDYDFSVNVSVNTSLEDLSVPAPACETHDFTGKWYRDAECKNEFLLTDKFESNIELFAGWTVKTFELHFPENEFVSFNINPHQCEQQGDIFISKYGGMITFTIEVKEKYNQHEAVIRDNGTIINPISKIFTISDIRENHSFTIDSMGKNKYTITFYTARPIIRDVGLYKKIDDNIYTKVYNHDDSITIPICDLKGIEDIGWKMDNANEFYNFEEQKVDRSFGLRQTCEKIHFELYANYLGYGDNKTIKLYYGDPLRDFLDDPIVNGNNLKFDGWYFDKEFSIPVQENFDIPNSDINQQFSFYIIYVKVKLFNLRNTEYVINNKDLVISLSNMDLEQISLTVPATRTSDLTLVLDNFHNSMGLSNKQFLNILAANINVQIILKGENYIEGGFGKDAPPRAELPNENTGRRGQDGTEAIFSKSNLQFTAIKKASLTIVGGDGGNGGDGTATVPSLAWVRGGAGGDGASAVVGKKVIFERFYEGNLTLKGGDGGRGTSSSSACVAGISGAGAPALVAFDSTFEAFEYSQITILGGKAGDTYDSEILCEGMVAYAGEGIRADKISIMSIRYSSLNIKGGDGGRVALCENRPGYGAVALTGDDITLQGFHHTDCNIEAGKTYSNKNTNGNVAVLANGNLKIENVYLGSFNIKGGDGADVYYSNSGNGNKPVSASIFTINNSDNVCFVGGNGGNGRVSGKGYVFTDVDRIYYKGVTFIDGKDGFSLTESIFFTQP